MNVKQKDSTYIAGTYARQDVVFTSGKGSLLWDENGKEYIDLGGGIAVNAFGIADTLWQNAVSAQLGKLQHTSNLYYTSPQAELAELLCQKTGMKKVFFSNSGAEANECAIKAARKYGNDRSGGTRNTIVTLNGGFHGRTIATITATGQDSFHTHFGPFLPGFVYADPDDFEDIQSKMAAPDVCAVMLELVQGEGGVHVLDKAFVQQVANYCAENDLLLIVDEVQTGNGRCGSLYAYTQYGIAPDILTTAKGLGGGLPIGATLFAEKTQNVLTAGTHGSTFGGNPVCAAGALNILSRLDEALFCEVREKSQWIFKTLSACSGVLSVSGLGLMIGVQTKMPVGEILPKALAAGVVVLSAKDKMRLLPALNIPWDVLQTAITRLCKILEA